MAKLINALMVLEYANGRKGVLLYGGAGKAACIDEVVQALTEQGIGKAHSRADEFLKVAAGLMSDGAQR